MTKNIHKKIFFSLGLFLLLFGACKTTKRAPGALHDTSRENIRQAIERIEKAQPEFQTANVSKMQIDVQIGERKMNVSANCKFIKDSAIVLSVQPFMGIELFRAEFFVDRFIIFDKLNKKYVEEKYNYFDNRLDVDINFYNLQDIITNRLFCIGETKVELKKCKLGPADGILKDIVYETENISQRTTIADDNSIRKIALSPKSESILLKTEYDDFSLTNNVIFPKTIIMKTENTKNDFNFVFKIDKLSFNDEINLSYTNRDKYTRTTFDRLLNK